MTTLNLLVAAERIAALKVAKFAEIDAACVAAILAGFQCDALGSVHTYPAKQQDQANLTASVTASLIPSLPDDWTTPFWAMDQFGNWAYHMHTAAQIQAVGVAGKSAIAAALVKNAALESLIKAATDAATLNAIHW